jgi:CRP-like cAMP-binding protein
MLIPADGHPSETGWPEAERPVATEVTAAVLDRHPVLRILPQPLRAAIMSDAALNRCVSGDSVRSGETVGFVVAGAFAGFDGRDLACVCLLGPGSTLGWEASLVPGRAPRRLLALLDTDWIEVPASVPLKTMGAGWLERMFARHALDRLDALEAASACHAVHGVHQRVANLIHRLGVFAQGDVRTTQAALAEVVGVQRTSVNASVKTLERAGVIATRRGRVRILDAEGLRALSCGC